MTRARLRARLISGELPLDDWVALVRATVPPPALLAQAPAAGLLAARVAVGDRAKIRYAIARIAMVYNRYIP